MVPVSAWLAARFGPGRIYNISLLGFAAGSALCGLAWNLDSIVAFRVLQAIPGGVLPGAKPRPVSPSSFISASACGCNGIA